MKMRFNDSKFPTMILAKAFVCLLFPALSVGASGNHFKDCNRKAEGNHKQACIYGNEIVDAINAPTGRKIQITGTNVLIGKCVYDYPLSFKPSVRGPFRETWSHVVVILKEVDGKIRLAAFDSPTSGPAEPGTLEETEAYMSVPANQEKYSEDANKSISKQTLDENSDPSKISYIQFVESSRVQ